MKWMYNTLPMWQNRDVAVLMDRALFKRKGVWGGGSDIVENKL